MRTIWFIYLDSIMKLSDIKIKDVIDMYHIEYKKMWYWNEYAMFEWWKLTNWWRFNENKNKAFDLAWKWRACWFPMRFIMMYSNCSKEEAIQILQERFYLDKLTKKNGRKSNIRF